MVKVNKNSVAANASQMGFVRPRPRITYFPEILRIKKKSYDFGILHVYENVRKHVIKTLKLII